MSIEGKRVPRLAALLRRGWRPLLALLSLFLWTVAIFFWAPRTYGWPFVLWVLALIGFVVSLPGGRPRWRELSTSTRVVLALLLLLSVVLRLPWLEAVPPNIAADEILPGYEAMQIAAGRYPNVFSTLGWFTIPGAAFLPPALVMKVLPGDPFYALRLSSMLTGLIGIVSSFLLARRLFNDRTALVTAFLLAAGFWHLHNSRTGFPFIQTSTVVPAVLYLLVRARQQRSLRCMAAAGVALGFALQGYFPVRALLMLVPMFLLVGWVGRRDRPSWIAAEALVLGSAAAMVLMPLLLSVDLGQMFGRSQAVLLSRPPVAAELARVYRVEGLPAIAWRNLHEAAGMLSDWADVCILNRSPHGLFDSLTLIAIGVGILIAVGQARLEALLLVAWAGLVFFLGVAMTDAPRASYRLGPAMPAFAMLAAFAIERTLLAEPPRWRWYRATVLPAVLIGLGSWVVLENYQMFFVDYSTRGDGRLFQVAASWRYVKDHCDGRGFYFLAAPDPTGGEAMVDIFCPQHRAITIETVPRVIDENKAATFLVMAWQRPAIDRLLQCYPDARVEEQRAPDKRYLFTAVEVSAAAVRDGARLCPPPPGEIRLDLTKPGQVRPSEGTPPTP